MGVDIQIEGVSYIGGTNQYGAWWVELDSVEIDQDIGVQQTTARFDVYIRGTYQNGTWYWPIARPRAGQEVVFLNADGTREFGGILQNPEEEELEPNLMVYHCNCSDYTQWFDRHLVNSTYSEGITVQQLIQQIVQQYVNTPGNTRTFTTNNVQQFPQIPLPILQFVYIPPSQVISQLADMTGWGWYIDFYRDVNFYQTEYFTSPLTNNTLNADDLIENPALAPQQVAEWVDLQLSEDTSQIKNVVYITGIYVAQQQLYTESFTGDGNTTVFTLGYQPPNDVSNITVSVNGVQQQIALDLIDGTPGGPSQPNTVYVNFSQQTIRFGTAPANGAVIKVTYYPMTQTVVGVSDPQSQAYMASIDGTDGIYMYNRMDPSLSAELPTLAQERAQMTLNKYAMPIIQGQFRSYIGGWRVGQYFTFRSQRRMQGDYDGKTFYVTRIQRKIVQAAPGQDWLFETTVNFSSIPFEI